MQQLTIPKIADRWLWDDMLVEVRAVCETDGLNHVAKALRVRAPELSNALNERNRSDLKLKHLPYFLRQRLTDTLPRLIVEHCELSLGEARPLSAGEKLARLEEALARAGAAGDAILADAFGRRKR